MRFEIILKMAMIEGMVRMVKAAMKNEKQIVGKSRGLLTKYGPFQLEDLWPIIGHVQLQDIW